jgi:hypothetical protein
LDLVDESIYKRCEEIISSDQESQSINQKIIELEKLLKPSLSPGQLKIYLEIESLGVSQKEHEGCLLYYTAEKEAIKKF